MTVTDDEALRRVCAGASRKRATVLYNDGRHVVVKRWGDLGRNTGTAFLAWVSLHDLDAPDVDSEGRRSIRCILDCRRGEEDDTTRERLASLLWRLGLTANGLTPTTDGPN